MRVNRAVVGLAIGLATAVLTGALASVVARSNDPIVVQITIHYSHY